MGSDRMDWDWSKTSRVLLVMPVSFPFFNSGMFYADIPLPVCSPVNTSESVNNSNCCSLQKSTHSIYKNKSSYPISMSIWNSRMMHIPTAYRELHLLPLQTRLCLECWFFNLLITGTKLQECVMHSAITCSCDACYVCSTYSMSVVPTLCL